MLETAGPILTQNGFAMSQSGAVAFVGAARKAKSDFTGGGGGGGGGEGDQSSLAPYTALREEVEGFCLPPNFELPENMDAKKRAMGKLPLRLALWLRLLRRLLLLPASYREFLLTLLLLLPVSPLSTYLSSFSCYYDTQTDVRMQARVRAQEAKKQEQEMKDAAATAGN